MKKHILFVGVIAIFALSSCKAVIITAPGIATGNPIGTKVGIQEQKVFMNFAFKMDLSVEKAAKNGGINKISTVDYQTEQKGPIVKYRIVVTGE